MSAKVEYCPLVDFVIFVKTGGLTTVAFHKCRYSVAKIDFSRLTNGVELVLLEVGQANKQVHQGRCLHLMMFLH